MQLPEKGAKNVLVELRPIAAFAAMTAVATACQQNPASPGTPGGNQNKSSSNPAAVQQFVGQLANAAGTVLAGYYLLAQDTATKQLVQTTTDGNGGFSLPLGADSYTISVLNSQAQYQGTLATLAGASPFRIFDVGSTAAGTVVTGFKASTAGTLVLDPSSGAVTAKSPTSLAPDSAITAPASGTAPIGIKLEGAGTSPYLAHANAIDSDGDGIPDLFDVDTDNNGVRNSVQGGAPKGAPTYQTVSNFSLFTNYSVPVGQTSNPASYVVTIDISPKPGYYDKLQSAVLTMGPSYLKAARVGSRSLSTNGTMQPDSGTWSDHGMKLYKYKDPNGVQHFEAFVLPGAGQDLSTAMKVGDVYQITFNYNDGTKETITNTLDSIFATVPGGVAVNKTAVASNGTVTGLASAPKISWNLLQNSDGTTLNGLNYAVEWRVAGDPNPDGRFDLGIDAISLDLSQPPGSSGFTWDSTKEYVMEVKAQCPGAVTTASSLQLTGKPNW